MALSCCWLCLPACTVSSGGGSDSDFFDETDANNDFFDNTDTTDTDTQETDTTDGSETDTSQTDTQETDTTETDTSTPTDVMGETDMTGGTDMVMPDAGMVEPTTDAGTDITTDAGPSEPVPCDQAVVGDWMEDGSGIVSTIAIDPDADAGTNVVVTIPDRGEFRGSIECEGDGSGFLSVSFPDDAEPDCCDGFLSDDGQIISWSNATTWTKQ